MLNTVCGEGGVREENMADALTRWIHRSCHISRLPVLHWLKMNLKFTFIRITTNYAMRTSKKYRLLTIQAKAGQEALRSRTKTESIMTHLTSQMSLQTLLEFLKTAHIRSSWTPSLFTWLLPDSAFKQMLAYKQPVIVFVYTWCSKVLGVQSIRPN